jgi:hypothetical protein
MGYTTEFSGSIAVEPVLTEDHAAELLAFSEERHEGAKFPGYWCNWEPIEQFRFDGTAHRKEYGAAIAWNNAEKFYSSAEWMKYIIDKFLAPKGYVLNGVIEAQGEDPEDRWRLLVEDNTVLTQQATVEFLPAKEVGA